MEAEEREAFIRASLMDKRSKEVVARAEWNTNRVSVSVTLGGQVYPVWFVASEDLGREADFLLPLTLPLAMVAGSHLKLAGRASPQLLSAVPKIQEILRQWGEEHWGVEFRHVPVRAEVRSRPADRASGVACFFSGGLDSFYTLLKHRDEVTHLIFVHGFDIPLSNKARRAQASHAARETARELGKSLIEVETNLQSLSNPLVHWNYYHGAALASVALLFQNRFRKVLIAAADTYAFLDPWGTHPLLDPLWSTELLEIEPDGCEATRTEKTAYISEYELALERLRICDVDANPSGVYNCGRCLKCLRSMIDLRAAGALERCKTFPSTIDLKAVANQRLPGGAVMSFARHRLKVLERLGTEPDLARAYAEAIDKSLKLERIQSLAAVPIPYPGLRFKLANTLVEGALRIYKLADVLVESAFRIPGVKKLVKKLVC